MSLPGKLLYHLWYRPYGYTRDLIKDGGPRQRRLTALGRQEMEAAAYTLAPPPSGRGNPVELHFLTGKKYWYQTAFSPPLQSVRSLRSFSTMVALASPTSSH